MSGDAALAAALAGEHATIWAYGVAGAHLSGTQLDLARSAEAAHRDRRDALLLRLSRAGQTAPAAAAGYALPFPVTDATSAVRLATLLEERTAALWRAAVPVASGADRRLPLDALIDCAVRATRWRRAAGQDPGTVALPGAPG